MRPDRGRAFLLVVLVALITVGALAVRARHLSRPEGTLGEDEARLALAAGGVLTSGVPVMPSGKLYFRGVINSYLTAISLGTLGRRDLAVRLPNVLVGSLLVPLLFLFGRELAGTAAGLSLAVFGAVQPELIQWSADGWMTSLFVVAFVAATYICHLAFVRDRYALQPLAGAAVVLTVLAHEFGILLASAVALTLGIRTLRGDRSWYAGRRTAWSLGLVATSAVVFLGLGLYLRAATLAGAAGEFAHYVGPSLDGARFARDAARWGGDYLPLAVAAAIGVVLATRARRQVALLLFTATIIAATTIWLLLGKDSRRYGLLLLPLIALAAAWALAEIGGAIARWRGLDARATTWLRSGVIVACFAFALRGDVRRAFVPPGSPDTTWLTELAPLGFQAGDAIISDNPEVPAFYLGRVHYWLRPRSHERYTFQDGDRIRHLYTGATRVAESAELYRLLREDNATTLWYIGDEEADDFPPGMREWLIDAAETIGRSPDGFLLLRVEVANLPPPPS